MTRKVPEPTDYIALKLSPEADVAVANRSTRGWNFDNFSPIWVHDQSQGDRSSHFTCRADVNDHSCYAREVAYPGFVKLQWPPMSPSHKSVSIKESDYRKAMESPQSKPMEPTSGGFVQIQKHVSEKSSAIQILDANVWGPISSETTSTFSLRTRTREISIDPVGLITHDWASYFDPESGKSSFVRFVHDGNPANSLKVDAWGFLMNQPDSTSQVVDFADLDKSKLILVNDLSSALIAPKFQGPGLPSAKFLVDLWTGTNSAAPDIITVTFTEDKVPRITVSKSTSGLKQLSLEIDFVDKDAPKLSWTQTKFLTVSKKKRLLLVHAAAADADHTTLTLRTYTYSESTKSLVSSQSSILLDGAEAHVQVLIGDVTHSGEEQLVVTFRSRVSVYNVSEDSDSSLKYDLCSSSSFPTPDNVFFTALAPAEDAREGMDLISVSSDITSTGKRILQVTLSSSYIFNITNFN